MSLPPRILHVGSLYPPRVVGGAERVVEQLAEAQAARGHVVGAAYLSPRVEPAGIRHGVRTFPQAHRNLLWIEDVAASARPLRTGNKLLQVVNARAAADFGAVMRRFAPDVVHTHSMVDLPPHIWREAQAAGARVVHTLHDYDLVCSRASLFRNGANCAGRHLSCRVLGGWKARFTGAIDAVAAVSAPVLEEHERHGLFAHLAPERRQVVWNGVSVAPAPRSTPWTADLVFGFLGRLVPEKGIRTLLAACRLLPGSGWQLRVAGRAPAGTDGYEEAAQGLPIAFAGFVEPAAFLDGIDVLVAPALWREPFGLTTVEAFARGVPVLASDLGAMRDLAGSLGPSWLVPPGDAEALAARMRALIASGRRALPPEAAFAPVLDAVSPGRMLDAYDRLYAGVLARPATAAAA